MVIARVSQRFRRPHEVGARKGAGPILSGLAVLVALVFSAPAALAQCKVANNIATCTGKPRTGVGGFSATGTGIPSDPAVALGFYLQQFTGPIAPREGTPGVFVRWYGQSGATDGASGQSATNVLLWADASVRVTTHDAYGLYAASIGGAGANDLRSVFLLKTSPANGGNGGGVRIDTQATVSTSGDHAAGVRALSSGGNAGVNSYKTSGGKGGDGGLAWLTNSGSVTTTGASAPALWGASIGGVSGAAVGGNPPYAGNGGEVRIGNSGALTTSGDQSAGIYANSAGGPGRVFGLVGVPGGNGGAINITNSGVIVTHGDTIGGGRASGINATSTGSVGHAGVSIDNIVGTSGGGGHGGSGGAIAITGSGAIATTGNGARDIVAISTGGGGGTGGDAGGIHADAGGGGIGGYAGAVTVTVSGVLRTGAKGAQGVLAASIGGKGGSGGSAKGFTSAFAGAGGRGGNAGKVSLRLDATGSVASDGIGIYASSRGGNGGIGGNSGAIVGANDGGGAGGNGGDVAVEVLGRITTTGKYGYGVLAQSVGGSGGGGGVSAGIVAVGGVGGGGSKGGAIDIGNAGSIATFGQAAFGVFAQSIGGGGGIGGTSGGLIAIGGGGGGAGTVAVGGTGYGCPGGGASTDRTGCNDGGTITVANAGTVTTSGQFATGIDAGSIGGGGGAAGEAFGFFAFGGSGGEGGNGGTVRLTNGVTGSIVTHGDDARGVLAYSVGGGGGEGGTATAIGVSTQVAIGGSGGNGGNGAQVVVDNDGSIDTDGINANAIDASSIGGGGGDGAAAQAEGLSGFTLSVGGSGGGGGIGGVVSVENKGSIVTTDDQSMGIFEQSVGGGGGNGGAAMSFGISPVLNVAVAVGGSGGDGGRGLDVGASNIGSIATGGADSVGIFAQSVGGGGGTGGTSSARSISLSAGQTFPSVSLAFSFGGTGGSGGNGGKVDIRNDGSINTLGAAAHGIDAQSVGGGGGKGGDATAAATAVAFGGSSIAISVGVGGNGGVAGDGGAVGVTNRGAIGTAGARAYGVFAQSVGGGGGEGGVGDGSAKLASNQQVADAIKKAQDSGKKGGTKLDLTLNLSMGGNGGAAGSGGAVNVANLGAIETLGDSATAVLAQSIGGGGGQGGVAGAADDPIAEAASDLSDVTGAIDDATSGGGSAGAGGGAGGNSVKLKIDLKLGGSGGAAGNGGAVTISNADSIVTHGAHATGIEAQSVGGGGGGGGAAGTSSEDGGDSAAAGSGRAIGIAGATAQVAAVRAAADSGDTAKKTRKPTKVELDLSLAMGGNGGAAGNGGKVIVDNHGSVATSGYNAVGVLVQSIGGGGGIGAASKGKGAEGVGAIAVSMGGNGGASGNGGDIALTNSGSIATAGGDSPGIFAQSVGGGGGISDTGDGDESGAGSGGSAAGNADLTGINFNVGGSGSASGYGGKIMVRQDGDITTAGDSSHGIEVQSIGGGGGQAGNASNGYTGKVAIGGSGGAGGNGGEIDIAMHGDIATAGSGADGIFAQSIGGGGGVSGDIAGNAKSVDAGIVQFDLPSFVGLLTVTRDAGSGGVGRYIDITDVGDITTAGTGANGIFAQSIGGGGGLAGTSATSILAFMGSNGDPGVGGTISIDHTGNIIVGGNDASAIFAQSVGGSGSDPAPFFATFGQVLDSHGHTAPGTGSNIDIRVAGGVFQGGSGDGAGIRIDNGLANTLTIANDATVRALSGVAIEATADAGLVVNRIDNAGSVIGDVLLGGSTGNRFDNQAGAMLAPNATVDLAGGVLTNHGALSPGGAGTATTVALGGNLVQADDGNYAVDLGLATQPSDLLNVEGSISLGGTVTVSYTTLLMSHPLTILTASGGVTDAGAIIAGATPVVGFHLDYADDSVSVVVDPHFADPQFHGAAPDQGLTPSEVDEGRELDTILEDPGTSPDMGRLLATLGHDATLQAYEAALDQLMPAAYLGAFGTAQMQGLTFADSLLSCHDADATRGPIKETDCNWAEAGGGGTHRGADADGAGYDGNAWHLQLGRQQVVAPGWTVGGSLGYIDWRQRGHGVSTLDGKTWQFGLVAKRQVGNSLLAGALSFGSGSFDATRRIAIAGLPGGPLVADSHAGLWQADAKFRAAWLFDAALFYMKPMLDVDVAWFDLDGFSESGAGALGLNVAGTRKTVGSLTPAVEWGGTFAFGTDCVVRPHVAIGLVAFSSDEWALDSRLHGAATGFTETMSSPRVLRKLSAGVDVFRAGGVIVRAQVDNRHASHFNDWDGQLKLSLPF